MRLMQLREKRNGSFKADAGIISSANFATDRVVFGSYDNQLVLPVIEGWERVVET